MSLGTMAPAARPAAGEDEVAAAIELRLRVFCGEQGVPRDEELDGLDEESLHVVVVDDEVVVATCRLRRSGDSCRLERMAVDADRRGTGLGELLLVEAERRAAGLGARSMVLYAQTQAAGFYSGAGYETRGAPFDDAGIEHVEMIKPLGRGPEER